MRFPFVPSKPQTEKKNMFSRDPRINPNTANIWEDDVYEPYARRTLKAVMLFVLLLIAGGVFIGWYFFTPEEKTIPDDQVVIARVENENVVIEPKENEFSLEAELNDPQMPGNSYPEETGRSLVYDFFYKMFGGIKHGAEDNPHNLNNVEQLDDFNMDKGAKGNVAVALAIDKYAEENATATQKEEETAPKIIPRHSLYDAINSKVYDEDGALSGSLYDILVNKETGQAQAVIVREDETRYGRDLKAIGFERVMKQKTDGDVTLNVTERQVEGAPEFEYETIKRENYVSLRNLQDGQILDYQGEVAGEIDAVIYENAEAGNIYFTLRKALTPNGAPSTFSIPFSEVKIVENPDGYDIQLNKEQTEALAATLFKG